MATFLSKCANQVLTVRPNRTQIIDGVTQTVPGEHIHFEHGEYETEDKKEITFLRKHQFYGNRITEIEETKEEKLEK